MRNLRLFVILCLVAFLAACALPPKDTGRLSIESGPYLLDTGDQLRISVYGDDKLTGTYTVDDRGAVAFPLVGPVPASGQTTAQVASRISAALASGFMRAPDVAVEIVVYRPYFIQGGVNTAGQFPYVYGMTVRKAVATAGGFKLQSNRRQATIHRLQDGRRITARVPMDFLILPGDTIEIGESLLAQAR